MKTLTTFVSLVGLLSSTCSFVTHQEDEFFNRRALVDVESPENTISFLEIGEISYQEDGMKRTKRDKKMTSFGCSTTTVLATVGVGGGGGLLAGAGGGAIAGSVVPVIGTAVGAILGGTIGFFVGAAAGGATTTTTTNTFCAQKLELLIVHRDLGIIDDDDTNTLMKEIKNKNQVSPLSYSDFNGLVIKDKNQVSAKVYANSESPYETDSFVEIKYLVTRNLHNTSELLTIWEDHFNKFLDELQRQIKNDIHSFSDANLAIWKDDKNFQIRSLLMDLRQNIEIIFNNHYIRKLYDRILSLENDLVELKLIVERMQKNAECKKLSNKLDAVPSVTSTSSKITGFAPKVIEFIPQSATVVPVIGGVFAGLSILNTAICFLNEMQ